MKTYDEIENRKKWIELLRLCIENSPGKNMPDCDTPEIKALFDEIHKDESPVMRNIKWQAFEQTSIPAKELQIQLCEQAIKAHEERFELDEEFDPWAEYSEDGWHESPRCTPAAPSKPIKKNEKPQPEKTEKKEPEPVKRKPGRPKKVYEQTMIDVYPAFKDLGDWDRA